MCTLSCLWWNLRGTATPRLLPKLQIAHTLIVIFTVTWLLITHTWALSPNTTCLYIYTHQTPLWHEVLFSVFCSWHAKPCSQFDFAIDFSFEILFFLVCSVCWSPDFCMFFDHCFCSMFLDYLLSARLINAWQNSPRQWMQQVCMSGSWHSLLKAG